jgi:hypothetical protein
MIMVNWGCDGKSFCWFLMLNSGVEFCHRFRYLVAEGF